MRAFAAATRISATGRWPRDPASREYLMSNMREVPGNVTEAARRAGMERESRCPRSSSSACSSASLPTVPFIERTLTEAGDAVWPDLLPGLAAIESAPALEVLYREAVTPRSGWSASGRPSLARLFLYRKARGDHRVGDEDLWRRIDGLFGRLAVLSSPSEGR